MYPKRSSSRLLRESGSEYPRSPVYRQLRPALPILRDLRSVPDPSLVRVLARFTIARHWLLRLTAAPADVLATAEAAARRYLDAAPAEWPERRLLAALLAGPAPVWRAVRLFRAAACRAEREGYAGSAEGLLSTAYAGAIRRLEYAAAAAAARSLAGQLSRRGAPAAAAEWRVRADRAADRARLWFPPSAS